MASDAVNKANIDSRLRRALLRKYTGQQSILATGDRCYYWRDGTAAGSKLRWKGPAIVVMREVSDAGPHADIYWIAHGTSLLRAAPEHVKPAVYKDTDTMDPLDRAKLALFGVRNRGVTHYTDLIKTNKRKREEIDSDEETEELDREYLDDTDLGPTGNVRPKLSDFFERHQDYWSSSDQGRVWTRHHIHARTHLFSPDPDFDGVPMHLFRPDRHTSIRREGMIPENLRMRDDWTEGEPRRNLHYMWTGTTTFFVDQNILSDDEDPEVRAILGEDNMGLGPSPTPPNPGASGVVDQHPQGEQPGAPQPGQHGSGDQPPAVDMEAEDMPVPEGDDTPSMRTDHDEVEPLEEPIHPMTPAPELAELPTEQIEQAMRLPAAEGSTSATTRPTFAELRRRHERLETVPVRNANKFGPTTTATHGNRSEPYQPPPSTDEANLYQDFEVDMVKGDLPMGWRVENGFLALNEPQDDWHLNDNYLVRRHYVPRIGSFKPTGANCPVPLHCLEKKRITKMKDRTILRDNWNNERNKAKYQRQYWTGETCFKLKNAWRNESRRCFNSADLNVLEEAYLQEVGGPQNLSERYMSAADRLAFREAKTKELASFFDNNVWFIDDAKNSDEKRVLKAHFILAWKKNPDGSPRAKARLVVQGFRDPDALSGKLNTTAPTLTRLSRNMVMAVGTMLGMLPFTADITTAFLQGKPYRPEADRVLWIKLPKDGESLLGLEPGHGKLMKLIKPMYGLCDAPRAWFEEASERILKAGEGKIVQHPLDACCFLVFDKPPAPPAEGELEAELVAIFGLHVDDLFGCVLQDDPRGEDLQKTLKGIFNFREWVTGDSLEYCGCQVEKKGDNKWKLYHENYVKKLKPITVEKHRAGQDLPVTEGERTQLRALLGALQWPSTQTSPHLQSQVSMLSGEITKATIKTLDAANKTLRFAKSNADCGLMFQHVADRHDVSFVAYSDASFATRRDLSSQGGYMVLMTNKHVANDGHEGNYVVLDWRQLEIGESGEEHFECRVPGSF